MRRATAADEKRKAAGLLASGAIASLGQLMAPSATQTHSVLILYQLPIIPGSYPSLVFLPLFVFLDLPQVILNHEPDVDECDDRDRDHDHQRGPECVGKHAQIVLPICFAVQITAPSYGTFWDQSITCGNTQLLNRFAPHHAGRRAGDAEAGYRRGASLP